ncbi:uncharacterized protein LOC133521380 [Cydia pomonella]|uniref:uncharacterized protein LOC133521380 n=1 Tax=Cydia pomonella TaxID=82600 RepID=UPI002ADDAB4B|nr:uncharacterized protein LOC133521380 [Cydia pomonella]
MVPEMQLVITENKQVIKTIGKETNLQASHLVKSLQEFQHLVNATLTNIIEDRGGINQEDNEELNEESEEDEDVPVTPKKSRK